MATLAELLDGAQAAALVALRGQLGDGKAVRRGETVQHEEVVQRGSLPAAAFRAPGEDR